jgi:hypothetical protein
MALMVRQNRSSGAALPTEKTRQIDLFYSFCVMAFSTSVFCALLLELPK